MGKVLFVDKAMFIASCAGSVESFRIIHVLLLSFLLSTRITGIISRSVDEKALYALFASHRISSLNGNG